jgi:hypothetical protein
MEAKNVILVTGVAVALLLGIGNLIHNVILSRHTASGFGGVSGTRALTLISTQTASSSTSLQFTGLPSTYNTLFLNCSGLFTSGKTVTPRLQIGEGAGPAWETGAHYTTNSEFIYTSGGPGQCNTTTAETMFECGGTIPSDPQEPFSLKAYIDNVGSSSMYKQIIASTYLWWPKLAGHANFNYTGYWNADKNPITGIELVAAGGKWVSGQCSLYGMN